MLACRSAYLFCFLTTCFALFSYCARTRACPCVYVAVSPFIGATGVGAHIDGNEHDRRSAEGVHAQCQPTEAGRLHQAAAANKAEGDLCGGVGERTSLRGGARVPKKQQGKERWQRTSLANTYLGAYDH